jgi:pimeloyl-ACP methyl ester carboxylesterase
MRGTKAEALDSWAASRGYALLRFDYYGHGHSSGVFAQGTITRWRDDALAVIDALSEGPQVLVGSSMGAWIAMLAAIARPERIAALAMIAPAPDFTETLIWDRMPQEVRRQVMEEGSWDRLSDYDDGPYPITKALIEDGRRHLLLDAPIALHMPVRILHGMRDPDVPWRHALKLLRRLPEGALLRLVPQGDHRLSTAADLARMENLLDGIVAAL